jgi:hypothetical protein
VIGDRSLLRGAYMRMGISPARPGIPKFVILETDSDGIPSATKSFIMRSVASIFSCSERDAAEAALPAAFALSCSKRSFIWGSSSFKNRCSLSWMVDIAARVQSKSMSSNRASATTLPKGERHSPEIEAALIREFDRTHQKSGN